MGAVVVTDAIYDAFMDGSSKDYMIELPHGYTYSGHPVSCAAALAALDILENDELVKRVATMAPIFEEKLHSLKGAPYITDIRNYGFAGGITLTSAPGEPALRPYKAAMKCWEKGFYVRYGGDTLQLGLPFITEIDEIDNVINAIGESLNEI
jgi:beta-alanine--pyruvate transaminase